MRKAFLSIANESISSNEVSLENNMLRLSLEADVLTDLLQTFKTTIPDFTNAIKNASGIVKGFLFSNNRKLDALVKKKRIVSEHIKNIDFINFGERNIDIPENFKGDLLEYAKKLSLITKELYLINSTTMVEYNTILASFLTNKDDKISLKDHTAFFKRVEAQRLTVVKQLSDFTKDTGRSKVKLRAVMKRMNDLEPLIEASMEITKIHSKDVITSVHSSVDQATELLDLIIARINNGDITNLSASAAMNISKGAYEVAKLVELVGVLYYDNSVLLNIVDRITDAVIDHKEGN